MFVKIIAQKVVKPILDSLLRGEGTTRLVKPPDEKTMGKPKTGFDEYYCDMCHMNFKTNHGMKVHKGKVHSDKKIKQTESTDKG